MIEKDKIATSKHVHSMILVFVFKIASKFRKLRFDSIYIIHIYYFKIERSWLVSDLTKLITFFK